MNEMKTLINRLWNWKFKEKKRARKDQMIFHVKEFENNLFWNLFTHSSDESWLNYLKAVLNIRPLLRSLYSTVDVLRGSPYLPEGPTLSNSTNSGKTKTTNNNNNNNNNPNDTFQSKPDNYANRSFEVYRLLQKKSFAFHVAGANMIGLTILLVIILFRLWRDGHKYGIQSTAHTLIDFTFLVYLLMWYFFALIILLFFAILNYYPFKLTNESSLVLTLPWDPDLTINLYDTWKLIGKIIISVKACIVVRNVFEQLFSESICYTSYQIVPMSRLAGYLIFQTAVDVAEACVYSILPFHWLWSVCFDLIQYFEIMLRIVSCVGITVRIPIRWTIVQGLVITISLYFIVLILFLSFNSQFRIRSSYYITQERQKTSKRKLKLVTLLCQDVKLIVSRHHMNIKRLLTSFAKPPGKDSASEKLFEYIIDIKDISSMVYNSVNSIGFLVGLEERQFQFSFRDEISLTTLFSNLIAEMTHLRPSVSFKKNNEPTTATHKGGNSIHPSSKLEKKISGLSTLSACRIEFEDAFSFNEILNTTADSRENDQLPRVFIRSNAICCRILFSSALHIAYLLWHHSYADSEDDYVPDEDRISINIKLEENNKTGFLKSLGSKASRIVTIRVEFEWKDEYAFPYFIHNEKDEDFGKLPFKPYLQSLCLICEKIVSTYDGYFEIFPSKISFTIIGEKVSGYSYTNANDNNNTDTSKSTDTDSEASSPHFNQQRAKELENDAETVSTFLSSKACLFISDAKMETLALETIKNLLRDKSIDTFQNIGDIIISLYSIIFVQTTAQAELIIRNERKKFDRNERFDGKIILLSEQLCFLGDELKQNYHIDYGLSLPTSNEELKSFQIWVLNYKSQLIRSKLRLERRGTTRTIEENEMILQQSSWYYRLRVFLGYETINTKSFDSDYNFATSSSTLDATSTRVAGERSTFTYRGRRLSLWSSYLDVTSKVKKDDQISAYHDPRMDIFLKWNFFAVPSRGIGRTLHMDVIIPLYFVFNLFLVLLNVRSFQALQGIIILVGSTYFRGIIHDFLLKPFGIPYKAFYFLWIGVIITSIIFSFLGDILRISFLPLPPHRWEFPPEGFHSFYEFLIWNHYWGLVATFNTIIVIPDCQLAIMSVLLPFPYSFILVIGYMAKAMGIWILYLSMFADTQQVVLGLGILLFFCVFFAYTQYFNYKGLQEEFLAIYNLLLSEDYLDRILGIANDQIIENYLQTIVQREQHLLLQLREYLTLKQLLLYDSQIYTIRQILFNQLMIQKLCFHFETSSNKDYFLSKPSKPTSLTLPKKHRKVSSWWKSLLRGSKELIRRSFGASKIHTTEENDLTRQSFLYDMKAHLLSSILQEIYEVYYLPSNSNNSSNNPPIPLYFYIHPAITMLRINRLLFLTSIIDLLELAIQNIQHLQQQERNHEFSDLYGDSSNKRTLNQQSLQHQLLIWIEPVKSKEILRFSQVRQLEITLLDTSYLGLSVKDIQQIREKSYYLTPSSSSAPSSTSSPSSSPANSASSGLPTLPMTELLYSRFHNISDNFIHFFKFQSNESNAGVILNHPEYHCYYKISLPYILCTSSYQLEQVIRQNLSLRHQKELGNPLSKNRFKQSQSMTTNHLKQSERNGIANNSDIQCLREFHQRFFLQYRILFNQEKRRQKEIKRLKEQEELKQSLEAAAKEKEKQEEEEGREKGDKNDPTTNPSTPNEPTPTRQTAALMEVLDEAELNNQIIPKRDRSNSTDTTNTSDSETETKQNKDNNNKEKEGGHGLPPVSFGSTIFPPHLRQNPYHSTRRDSKNNLPPKPLRQLQSLPPNPSTPNNRSSPNTSFVSPPYLGNSRGGGGEGGGGGYIGSMKIFHLYKSDTSLIINQLIELFQKKDWKCIGMNLLFKKNKGGGGGGGGGVSSGGSVGGGGSSGDRGRHHHYSSTYSTKIKGQVPPHSYSSTSTVGHVEQQQLQQHLQSTELDDENTVSYRFPNKSEFIDDDILIIEYAPLERYHDEMPYDVREFIHYLRACGSMALIVVVYAPYVNPQEDQNVQLLMNPNQYSDAAVADLHLRLPWKVPLLDVILKAWEEKLFQKMLK